MYEDIEVIATAVKQELLRSSVHKLKQSPSDQCTLVIHLDYTIFGCVLKSTIMNESYIGWIGLYIAFNSDAAYMCDNRFSYNDPNFIQNLSKAYWDAFDAR
jgi:hypothetical protein